MFVAIPEIARQLLPHETKQRLLTNLRNASKELNDALSVSIPAARYDPALLSQGVRDELSEMLSSINKIVRHLEGTK
jgi:hypothetical protein